MKTAKLILKIGIFGTFIGHGILAIQVQASWLVFFETVGIAAPTANILMPIIGILDILVAFAVVFRPLKFILLWAVFWAFLTALMRPLSGIEIWAFVERWSFWAAPLALLFINGFPRRFKDLWRV